MRISVAMATQNSEQYIEQQLDSILENLTEEDEIVISDDWSTDETRQIIEEYQETSNIPIRLIDGPKQGKISNFERALVSCKGEFVFLAEPEHVWAPNKVERVMKAFHDHVQLIMHDAVIYNESMNTVIEESFFDDKNPKAGVFANMTKNHYLGCCMAFRRELLRQVLPIPTTISSYEQWIGVISDYYNGKSVLLEEKLMNYRCLNTKLTESKKKNPFKSIKNFFGFLNKFIDRIR
jgi:glycosyltransferase involved in cell wall biosynthesis